MDPSEGPADPILLALAWVKLPDGIPDLSGNMDDMLDAVLPQA
jgi:hypothetical protein